MNKDVRRIPAVRIQQGETVMYLASLKASDILEGTKVDAWTPSNTNGYQRIPKESRFKGIARYITGKEGVKPLLPQAVVLNMRGEGKLKFHAGSNGAGTLEIPEGESLQEVDGQHRLGGLRYAMTENPDLGDYCIPAVITEGLPRLDEAVLFYVINTEQKRVPTDLAQRLIEQRMEDKDMRLQIIEKGQAWIPKGTKVVDFLVATEGNPWYGKIGIPGTKISGILTKQVSFVSSLKPVLTSMYGDLEVDDIAQLVMRYWQALSVVFPEAFETPQDYVIQKTVGIFPLHMIAPLIFDRVRAESGRITKDGLVTAIKAVNNKLAEDYDAGSTFWNKDPEIGEAGKYAGAKGFNVLASILRAHLPEMKKMKVV